MWQFNKFDDVVNKGIPVVGGSPPGFTSPWTGGTGNPYSASVAIKGNTKLGIKKDDKAYAVVCLAKIDGLVFGMFQVSNCPFPYSHSIDKKSEKNHAEDGFISAFE